ncbi:MAG: 3'-5' exonuclease [Crocinitomicaceae bacterium]|nr:MAG: 3'-5' exonuclease [Crocinitomicaceae bacterium]
MKLKLERPLAIFDLEATGLNISQDRIVEIAIIKINPDGTEETFTSKVNPEMPIPEEVSLIHGIYDKDVADAPKLGDLAQRIIDFVGDADLGGYNSNKFDIPMLAEEMLRVGSDFKMTGRHFVDVQNIFHKMEQRTLAAAFQFYCQSELDNAHNALADTSATWKVLQSQLEKYPDLKAEVPFLADFSKAGNQHILDFAGRLAVDENGDAVYNFGKHKGKTVKQVNEDEPGYYGWFVSESTDFPKYTKQKLKEEMDKIKSEIRSKKEAQEAAKAPFKKVKEESIEDKLNALKQKFGK